MLNKIAKAVEEHPDDYMFYYNLATEYEIEWMFERVPDYIKRSKNVGLWDMKTESIGDIYNNQFFKKLKNDLIIYCGDLNLIGTNINYYKGANEFSKVLSPEIELNSGLVINCDLRAHRKLSPHDTNQYALTEEQIEERINKVYEYLKNKLEDFDVRLISKKITPGEKATCSNPGTEKDRLVSFYVYDVKIEFEITLQNWAKRSDNVGLWDLKESK
jgi:hypothetical protein